MKTTLLTIVCLLMAKLIFSQIGSLSIKGSVQDSVSNKNLDYITVGLKDSLNKPLKSALTKSDGSFLFEKLKPGKYSLLIIAVGYKNQTVPVVLSQALDLGKISIAAQSKNLKDIVISADKPLIKQEVDRISYDGRLILKVKLIAFWI